MHNRRNRGSGKKVGLSVRYCFDGQEHRGSDENDQGVKDDAELLPNEPREATQPANPRTSLTLSRKPPHHLPRPNFWFHSGPGDAGLKQRASVANARFRSHTSFGGDTDDDVESESDRCADKDPGFFTTGKVEQPPREDMLSWDSSCSSSSSSTEDVRDNFGRNNRAGRRVNNYMWGSSRPPVPPPARNVTANKADDGPTRSSVTTTGGQGGSGKRMENTYRMEPKACHVFAWYKLKRPMVSIIDQLLDDFAYNVKSGPAITRKMCDVIMKLVKKTFDWPRYKFICNVYLAQLKLQGIMIADRALWCPPVDNVTSYVHKTKMLVCVVTFHALYFE